MNDHAQSLSRLMSAFVLTLSAVSTLSTPPRGSFGFLINPSFSSSSVDSTGVPILGVMNFDGTLSLLGIGLFGLGCIARKRNAPK